MKTISVVMIIILGSIAIACAQEKNPKQWLDDNTYELQTETGFDFEALKKAIGNKRIVALGESSHGLGSYYALKSEIVKYLHAEMDFKVLAMEGGLADIYFVYKNLDTLTTEQIKKNSVFGNFAAKEADTLFSYLKKNAQTKNPLHYEGFDTQVSSSYFHYVLKEYISPYNKELADSIYVRMNSYQKPYGANQNGDEEGYYYHRDQYINTSKELKTILETNEIEIAQKHNLTALDFEVMYRTLDMFVKSVDIPFGNSYDGYILRDKLMFENLDWLLTKVHPTKKFIIWAHNGHIENENKDTSETIWMGNFLKEKYKDDYYSIGLFSYEGEIYQFWTQKTFPFKNDGNNSIEKILFDTNKSTCFLPLSEVEKTTNTQWLFEKVNGYELENGGVISFVPTSRFDAIISRKKGTPPTYE